MGRAARRRAAARLGLWLALLPLLPGCATYFPVNERLESWPHVGYSDERVESATRSDELLLLLAFSGGGIRAAAFSYGVLEGLDSVPLPGPGAGARTLLDEVDHITAVSGGSFTAAYYGLRGRQIFEDYEERFLTRNVQSALVGQLLWPVNWGLLFSPYFERTDLVARFFDDILFEGATFADLATGDGPFVQINATDLATGAPFPFVQAQFDFLCSDLLPYQVSRAVAASSAVPGPMSPLTLRNFAGSCPFEPPEWIEREIRSGDAFGRAYMNAMNLRSYLDAKRRRFIRLVDGGISDNLGVRGPFDAALLSPRNLAERPASFGNMRWVVLIVANAATTPETSWEQADISLPLISIIDQTTTVQINRYNVETLELLRQSFADWNAASARWERPVSFHLVELDFARIENEETRRRLNQTPTSLKLEPEQVELLRAAAGSALRDAPEWQRFLRLYAEAQEGPAPALGADGEGH